MIASRIALALTAGCLAMALPCATLAGTTDGQEVTVAASPAAKLPTKADLAKADLAKADSKTKPDSAATPASTKDQVIARLAAAPRIDRTDYSRTDATASSGYESNGRTIHGVAEVSIGTGGYRSAYVSSQIPIGETGTLGIAVSQTDFGKNSPYVYGYDSPYGYGGYGRGRRGGTMSSVGLSLDMSDHDGNRSDTPEGCAPGFRDGDRYIEPVWVKHAPGDHGCGATADQP